MRGFATYKRPTLLLRDPARLVRLVTDRERPLQIVVAGKAHPADQEGAALVRAWAVFARDPAVRDRVVFLEDHDMAMAGELVGGVDLWLNTPRRPWEASGTSGMKVLVNGGLNLSELDGWWAEACRPEVGWALGDGAEHDSNRDPVDAEQLYRVLEDEVVPTFYERDRQGLPRAWISRMRESMATLTPQFSSNRMVREYTERLYLPARPRQRCNGNRLRWLRICSAVEPPPEPDISTCRHKTGHFHVAATSGLALVSAVAGGEIYAEMPEPWGCHCRPCRSWRL